MKNEQPVRTNTNRTERKEVEKTMKKSVGILFLALLLVACTGNPGKKSQNNESSDNRSQGKNEKREEATTKSAEGMQLLKLSESESLKIQSGFNNFFGAKTILHEGRIYFSRIKSLVRDGRIEEVGELYRMNEDGSDLIKLSDDAAKNLSIAGDYLYYVNLSEHHTLYRMKLDGSEREKLNDYRIDEFVVDGDRVFFVGENGSRASDAFVEHNTRYFGTIKTDASEYRKILSGNASYLLTDGENLYAYYPNTTGGTYRDEILCYPLERLRTESDPEKLNPKKIEEIAPPYAVLKDGSIITAEVPETDVYEDVSNRVKVKGRDGTVKIVKDLRFEDRFLNLFDGKIFTVRIKNWDKAESEENEDIEKALYEIDENGEREIFSYKRDEWTLNEMIGSNFFCRHSNTDDLYLLNTETGQMKQILAATPPSEKK